MHSGKTLNQQDKRTDYAKFHQQWRTYTVGQFLEEVPYVTDSEYNRVVDVLHVTQLHEGQVALKQQFGSCVFLQPIILFREHNDQGHTRPAKILDGQHRLQCFTRVDPTFYANEKIQVLTITSKTPDFTFSRVFNTLHAGLPQNKAFNKYREEYPFLIRKIEKLEYWIKTTFAPQVFKLDRPKKALTKFSKLKLYPGVITDFILSVILDQKDAPMYKRIIERLNSRDAQYDDSLIECFKRLNQQWANECMSRKKEYAMLSDLCVVNGGDPECPHMTVCFINCTKIKGASLMKCESNVMMEQIRANWVW